jgi:hypothetical protein
MWLAMFQREHTTYTTLTLTIYKTFAMPIYLANPKKSGTRQSDGSRFTEYNRTRPSGMYIMATHTGSLFLTAMWTCWSHLMVLLFAKLANGDNKRANLWVNDQTVRDTNLSITDLDAVLPFFLPNVEIAFRDNRAPISTRHIQWLLDHGADTVKIFKGGRSSDIFRFKVHGLTETDLKHLLAMKKDMDPKYTATADYVTIASLSSCLRIREQLSLFALAQYNFHSTPGTSYIKQSLTAGAGVKAWTESRTNDEELEESAIEDEDKMMYPAPTHVSFGIVKDSPSPKLAWGDMENKPNYGGLAVPYVSNYANPDPEGIAWFTKVAFRQFASYGDPIDSTVAILEDFRRDIHQTSFGHKVSHYVRTLQIGIECVSPVYAFMCPEKGYCGSFLGGTHYTLVRGDGTLYMGVKPENTDTEWATLSLHETTLDKIRVIGGMPVDWEKPKTMRRLRTLIFAGGEPNGQVKNQISELLPDLTFLEAQDSINSTTMLNTLTLLTSEGLIPDNTFLDRRSFWALDRTTLVLARFGSRAPSWSTGGEMTRFCSGAHGEGIARAKEYASNAPTPLQVVRKPIRSAVFDWTHLLNYGFTGVALNEIGENGFTFRGGDRQTVWAGLGSGLSGYMTARGQGSTATTGPNKRGLEEGEVEESEGNVRGKKRERFW